MGGEGWSGWYGCDSKGNIYLNIHVNIHIYLFIFIHTCDTCANIVWIVEVNPPSSWTFTSTIYIYIYIDYWLLVIGNRLLVIGYWLLVIGINGLGVGRTVTYYLIVFLFFLPRGQWARWARWGRWIEWARWVRWVWREGTQAQGGPKGSARGLGEAHKPKEAHMGAQMGGATQGQGKHTTPREAHKPKGPKAQKRPEGMDVYKLI